MKYKRGLLFVGVIILLYMISSYAPPMKGVVGKAIEADKKQDFEMQTAVLLRVVDGDTIEAQVEGYNETWKIRLQGINTPEKGLPFASDAKEFLKQFENQSVQLLRDYEDTDMYDRKLRYIFYDNRLLNREIVEKGLASIYYYSGLKYEKELVMAEEYARKNELGIWTKSAEVCPANNCLTLKQLNYTGEFFVIKNNCDFECVMTDWFVRDAGRQITKLESINANEEKTFYSAKGKDVWNNNADKFFMFDKNGLLVIYYAYP
jgi:endonuclease YncB( thermonuclease family)